MTTPSRSSLSRRRALQHVGVAGAALAALGAEPAVAAEPAGARAAPAPAAPAPAEARRQLRGRVFDTPLIDTHEHLIEESERLRGAPHPRVPCDDWALLFSHYLNSDLATAGMPKPDLDRFLSTQVDAVAKWDLLAPWWPAAKHTGYAQAVRLAIHTLYDVEELSADTVRAVQAGYERVRRPGFYPHLLQQVARIESCQVNSLTGEPFTRSAHPTLLMQDLSIVGMFAGPNFAQYAPATGLEVRDLAGWHRVIDWWFERYAPVAVAVKSQHAYSRDIDYARVPPDQAEPLFSKVLRKDPLTADERKRLEDHLFWYAVDQATKHGLPVKLHTGYYAGHNSMPLARLARNAGSAADLCRLAPDTQFVFMHLCYPYYEDLLAVAKQWSNAYVDMCWAWIINPLAAKDYFQKHLLTAPANKLLPFGGDYIPVEPVVGHALLARHGIAQALAELVEEGWLKLGDALELVEPILNGNARRLFRLERKTAALRQGAGAPTP